MCDGGDDSNCAYDAPPLRPPYSESKPDMSLP